MASGEGSRVLRVGTRRSPLAMIQTELFIQAVLAKEPSLEFEVVGITTTAERQPTTPIPDLGQGVFVKEIQIALANDEIDVAVHSLKDRWPQSCPETIRATFSSRETDSY